jgi:hypothetical protein
MSTYGFFRPPNLIWLGLSNWGSYRFIVLTELFFPVSTDYPRPNTIIRIDGEMTEADYNNPARCRWHVMFAYKRLVDAYFATNWSEGETFRIQDNAGYRPGRFIPVNGSPGMTTIAPRAGTDPFVDKYGRQLTQAEIDAIRDGRAPAVTGSFTPHDFDAMLEQIYRTGGNPEIVYTTPERAYERGLINWWEFTWLRLRRAFRGIWRPNATSGSPSARPTAGSEQTELPLQPTPSPSGTSSTSRGAPERS